FIKIIWNISLNEIHQVRIINRSLTDGLEFVLNIKSYLVIFTTFFSQLLNYIFIFSFIIFKHFFFKMILLFKSLFFKIRIHLNSRMCLVKSLESTSKLLFLNRFL